MTMEIRIKETVVKEREEIEEVYTPKTIRELWSDDTAETSLVLALLEKWERAEAQLTAANAEIERLRADNARLLVANLPTADDYDALVKQLAAMTKARDEIYGIAKRTFDRLLMTREEAERLDELRRVGGDK